MKDNKDLDVKKLLVKEASASSVAASNVSAVSAEEELLRMRKIKLIKLSAIMILLSLIIVFMTLGWFAANKVSSASGGEVRVADYPLVIEVQGENAENKSLFSKANDALFGTGDTGYQEGYQPDTENLYFQATSSKNRIIWEKSGTATEDGHYNNGLEPDACGKLTFWVVAKEAGTYDPEFSFQIKGFHAVTHDVTTNGTTETIVDYLFEINESLSDHADVDNTLTVALEAEKIQALSYIRGHILFFRNRDSDGYYSDFLGTDRSFRLSDYYSEAGGTTFTENEKKQITVYWKWANTFEQMIYDSSQSSFSPIIKLANSPDRTLLYTYMSPTNNSMFYGLTNAEVSGYISDVQGNDSAAKDLAISQLSSAYNDADQEIGDMVNYILIEMSTAH